MFKLKLKVAHLLAQHFSHLDLGIHVKSQCPSHSLESFQFLRNEAQWWLSHGVKILYHVGQHE